MKNLFQHKWLNSSLFDEFVCKLGLFWHKWANLHTNELNTTFFCSTSTLKAPNRLKPLKLWHLSKSVHIGENSQILTVSNIKIYFALDFSGITDDIAFFATYKSQITDVLNWTVLTKLQTDKGNKPNCLIFKTNHEINNFASLNFAVSCVVNICLFVYV
jgi:hypothetical protein